MFKIGTLYGAAMLAGLALGWLIASFKNRDSSFWGFCFFLPPALLILLAVPRQSEPRTDGGSNQQPPNDLDELWNYLAR